MDYSSSMSWYLHFWLSSWKVWQSYLPGLVPPESLGSFNRGNWTESYWISGDILSSRRQTWWATAQSERCCWDPCLGSDSVGCHTDTSFSSMHHISFQTHESSLPVSFRRCTTRQFRSCYMWCTMPAHQQSCRTASNLPLGFWSSLPAAKYHKSPSTSDCSQDLCRWFMPSKQTNYQSLIW